MKPEEVLIIGAGPAGVTAAIQLKRCGIPFVLLEKDRVGGLLWNANLVENYPGFPDGVSGPKLVGLLGKQMERLGVQVTFGEVTRVDLENGHLAVGTSLGSYRPRFLVVASGTVAGPAPVTIPAGAQGRAYSEVYPLLGERGKQVIILGAGDAAFDYALNLTKNGNSVTILNRGNTVKCLRLLWERAAAEPSITYRAEAPVREVALDEAAKRLEVRLRAGERLEADYLLFATGRIPKTDFVSVELLEKEIEGLYFIGDVKNGPYRQAAIAAGDGLRAAMEIHSRLNPEASKL